MALALGDWYVERVGPPSRTRQTEIETEASGNLLGSHSLAPDPLLSTCQRRATSQQIQNSELLSRTRRLFSTGMGLQARRRSINWRTCSTVQRAHQLGFALHITPVEAMASSKDADEPSLWSALVESAAYEWTLILSLIFGGCCSNVWALEAVLRDHPRCGTFLTFAQFVYVALQNLSSQVELASTSSGVPVPRLKKRQVPLRRWIVQVILFLGVSLSQCILSLVKSPV